MAKQSSSKTGKQAARGRSRRKLAVRREGLSGAELITVLARSPELGWGVMIAAGFVVLATTIMAWSSTQPLHAPNQPARETVLARVAVEVVDDSRTTFEREAARQRVPRVYKPDEALIRQAIATLRSLPTIVGQADSVDAI
ncbi:MAG: hypothetical protein AAFY46_08495, partial [Planctomycetota bacterium]